MLRWRKCLKPACPSSLKGFNKILKSQEWKHLLKYNNHCLNCKLIKSEDGRVSHLVFFDRHFIQALFKKGSTEEIFADATFKTASILLEQKTKNSSINKARQLFTLMARKFNHVISFKDLAIC